MLRWRLVLSGLLIAALVLLFWIDFRVAPPGIVLIPVAVVLSIVAAGEILRLISVREQRPVAWVVYGGSAVAVAVTGIPFMYPGYPTDCPLGATGWPLAALTATAVVAIVAELCRYENSQGATKNLALSLFGVAYVGLLLSFLVQLRFVSLDHWDGVPLLSLIAVVKLCDIGAYTVGRLIGRHKLAPRLSPGKTVEGAIGGLAFSCSGSVLLFCVLVPHFAPNLSAGWQAAVVYGLLLGIAGIIGDLAESLLKRDAGYKDSSGWMPGFGGVLDLLDSLLVAAPVSYGLWIVGLFN